MREFTEIMMVLRQMLGIDGWVAAAFLVGMFAAVIFRRDQIVSFYQFRLATILFSLALVLPVVIWPILQLWDGSGSISGSTRGATFGAGDLKMLVRVAAMAIGPVMFGLAVVFGIGSMLPRESRHPAPPDRPKQPHPLD
jgi:hypothetical protein